MADEQTPDWLSATLASLPDDDPEIPADVARRLDAVLAQLRPVTSSATGGPTTGPATELATEPAASGSDGTATGVAPPSADVIPLRPRSRTSHRFLLTGVAAAAVVVLGGLSWTAVQRAGSAASSAEGAAAPGGLAQPARPVAYVASGRDYRSVDLPTQTRELVASTAAATGFLIPKASTADRSAQSLPPASLAPSASEATSPPVTTRNPSESPGVTGTDEPTSGCLDEIGGEPGTRPVVVDAARFATQPAFIIVLRGPADEPPGTVDVWVVGRDCSASDARLVTYARVRP